MSRRLFHAQFRPPLPVNGQRFKGRSFLMVTMINASDTGMRVFLENEYVPNYFRGRVRLLRLPRIEITSAIEVCCELPAKAANYYLFRSERMKLEILIEPRSKSFFLLDSNKRLTSLTRNTHKQLDLPERQ